MAAVAGADQRPTRRLPGHHAAATRESGHTHGDRATAARGRARLRRRPPRLPAAGADGGTGWHPPPPRETREVSVRASDVGRPRDDSLAGVARRAGAWATVALAVWLVPMLAVQV